MMGDGPAMPDVRPGAVEAARERSAEAAPAPSAAGSPVKGKTDVDGRTFDPSIHDAGPDGGPQLNRDGWIKKRRGAKGKAGTAPKATQSKVDPGKRTEARDANAQASAVEGQIDATAETATTLVFSIGQMVGGEEFAPESGEPEALKGALATYFKSKNVTDIPPGALVAIVLFSYVGKRWNRPVFKEKRTGWWMGVKRWWNDWKFRRAHKAPASDDAREVKPDKVS
jgi:hypothetical protein